MKSQKRKAKLLSWVFLIAWPSLAISNPSSPEVVGGQAAFSQPVKNQLHIKASNKTIINWKEFSIDKGELTKFIQPSKNSTVLNRVTSGNPSAIYGALEANGKIYLINPNGILVGKEGVINTAAFSASTLDWADEMFLNDGDQLFSGDNRSSIVNLGTISAWDGDVTLIGYTVDNQGSISAPQGSVGIAVGQEVLIKPLSDEKIFIRPRKSDQDRSGVGLNNTGEIVALRTELKADGNPYAMAINHSGSIDALNVREEGGRIMLVADEGFTEVSGSLYAAGGDIRVLGKTVHLTETAQIDASGDYTAGNVYVGGGLKGENPKNVNAKQTVIESGAVIHADSRIHGDGGQVIVKSAKDTYFEGDISAKGGLEGGNGGFVEVSGKNLNYKGSVSTIAEQGSNGTLLLDPTNITIQNSGVTSLSNILTADGEFFFDNTASESAILTVTDLQNALQLNNVIVTTESSGPACGDIIVQDHFTWTTQSKLTLEADHDIILKAIITPGPGSTTQFTAGRDFRVNAGGGLHTGIHNFDIVNINTGRDVIFHTGSLWNQLGGLIISSGRNILIEHHTVFNLLNSLNHVPTQHIFFAKDNVVFDHHTHIHFGDSAQIYAKNFDLGESARFRIDETIGVPKQEVIIQTCENIHLFHDSHINIRNRGDSLFSAGNDILLGFKSLIALRDNSSLTMIADHDIRSFGEMFINGEINSRLTLVADNANPKRPEFGTGGLILPGVKFHASGGIKLYSSERQFDCFTDARFNDFKFKYGTAFVDSYTEKWNTYYPEGFGGFPYKSFYKVKPMVKLLDHFYSAITEPFQRWREFDRFMFGYDLVSFGAAGDCDCACGSSGQEFWSVPFEFFDDSGCCIFDERLSGAFNLHYSHNNVYRGYLYLRTIGPIDWVTQRTWSCSQ